MSTTLLEHLTPDDLDDIARELDAMSSQADVEAQLAALKAGQGPQAIEGTDSGTTTEPNQP